MAESQIAIPIPYDEIVAFCERPHIRKLSLFGSVLRDDFSDDSDIDVLVEFEEGHVPGFFKFAGMGQELGELLGREVDLGTTNGLSRFIRAKVLAKLVTVYEH